METHKVNKEPPQFCSDIFSNVASRIGQGHLFNNSTKTEDAIVSEIWDTVRTSPEFVALIEAAEPFERASRIAKGVRGLGEDTAIWHRSSTKENDSAEITIGDLRKLAAAVKALKGGEG